jgi:hypothetical protein
MQSSYLGRQESEEQNSAVRSLDVKGKTAAPERNLLI